MIFLLLWWLSKSYEINMKIAVITYHRAINYGSALQAYALNRFLNKQNEVECRTIDYIPKGQTLYYKKFEKVKTVMSILRNMQTLFYLNQLNKKEKNFELFLNKDILLTPNKYYSKKELNEIDDFDLYICGSDQIWNPNCIDFTSAYLLDFVDDKSKCISYSPSIAVNKLENKQIELFREKIESFRNVSIREINGKQILKENEIYNGEVTVTLDPVFLLEKEEWDLIASPVVIPNKYIFCYFIGDIEGMRTYAIKLRKKYNLPIIVVYQNLRDMLYINKKIYSAGPREFLFLLKNATYVFSNSFHAVAFSIIYSKRFGVYLNRDIKGNANSRIDGILGQLNLTQCIITKNSDLVDIYMDIDYTYAISVLEKEKLKSKNYLFNAMEED